MRTAPETAVIVLNYNGKRCLGRTLRTLLASAYRDFEIILVDNSSADGSLEDAERTFKAAISAGRMRVIRSKVNTGFAEGNNIGYRAVREGTRYVALLNYDSIVPRGWLGTLVHTMRTYPSAGIAGSTVIAWEDRAQARKAVMAHAECTVTPNMELAGPAPRDLFVGTLFFHLYVSGNGMIVRKSAFRSLFNPDYFAYAEDVDLCWNARLRGLDVILRKDAVLYHLGSVAKRSDTRISEIATFNGTKNQIINYLVHYSILNTIRIWPLFTLTQLGQMAYDRRKIPYKLKAYLWTLLQLPRILRYRRQVQAQRKVPDERILRDLSGIIHSTTIFPPSATRRALDVLNRLSILYCRIVRIPVLETLREGR